MDLTQIDKWFSAEQQKQYTERLQGRVGLTRRRAECFVKLWAYLWAKHYRHLNGPLAQLDLANLDTIDDWVSCTCREAALLFYVDSERGSERSAGLMLDKLATLGLIKKTFDGNTISVSIPPIPELTKDKPSDGSAVRLITDAFDPRCDAIPVANLLAKNYNWMNRNGEALPYRIAERLRHWASQYAGGMRVLRQQDTQNPVGFYLLYPTQRMSESNFFGAPSRGLHLSAMSDEADPFAIASPGDPQCQSIFVRSWMIDGHHWPTHQHVFLQDAQQILQQMQQDFPNLCDLYTLVIHPRYEALVSALRFQKLDADRQANLYWAYLPLDRFLATEVKTLKF